MNNTEQLIFIRNWLSNLADQMNGDPTVRNTPYTAWVEWFRDSVQMILDSNK